MSSKHSLHSGDLALRLEAIRTSQEPESEPNVASHPPTLPIISSFSGLEDYPAREPDIDTTRDISLFDADTTPTRSIYRPSPAASGFIFPVVDADQSKMAKILQTFGLRPKPTRAPPLAPYSPQFENNLFSRSTNGPNCAVFPEVANQEAGFDAVFSRSSSRRSESSDGSCVSSNFREYSSSSGSGSDSDSNGGDQRERNLLLNPTTLVPTSVLNIGKTHRLIRRYVTELGNPHSVAQLIAATGLLQTSKKDDRGRQEVLWCLTKGKKNRQLTLKHLFRLADDEAYSSPHYCQLRHTATSAQLIDTVISGCVDTTKLVTSMCIYLQDWTVLDGAAGVQYTLEKWRHLFQAIPSVEVILHRYAERVLVHTLHVATPPALAMCLLKLMLQEDTIHARELSRAALDRIISTLGPPVSYSTSASLHLIRSMDTVPHHILSHNVIDSLMYIITNNSDQLLKRLAFSTLAKLLPYRATIENRVMDLAIHVLLWNTNWQHYHSAQKQAKLWDDSVIIPHDDAYRIISHIPPLQLISGIKFRFQSHQLALRSEPLLALVVERSKTPDLLWPRTLSSLIQAGVIDFLIRIAQQSLPHDIGHRDYRVIHGAKRDALITVIRIFEQMMAKDVQCIGVDVPNSLKSLVCDKSQPLSVQWQAKTALQWWNRLHGIEQIQELVFRPV